MDAGNFYALLRFEEASLALRAVMRMGLVDEVGDRFIHKEELRQTFGLTEQGARTFFSLLVVMEVLSSENDGYRVTKRAASILADGISTSRKPYLAMGSDDEVDSLVELLRGTMPDDAVPLYGDEQTANTVMNDPKVGRDVALGLSSRARNFAGPLAAAIARHVTNPEKLADIGAGSPHVAQACLLALPSLEKAILVDRANGMRFAREMIENEKIDAEQMELQERCFFQDVPVADVYVVSNTAHDWQQQQYATIMSNIRSQISTDGLLCIHEPLLMTSWDSDGQWVRALWMACYAQTLFRLTLGQGTCYTIAEHNQTLDESGFESAADPAETCDGCTALFYRAKG